MQIQPGIYRHYKGPEYRVLGVAHHTETDESLVIYQLLYGDYGLGARPLALFHDTVEVDGEQVPRFALVEAEEGMFKRPDTASD
ncbi:DUF1653 domain-containing protein [Pseudomonas sp. NY15372]|uniref:DUF1653 domain-containing protein n=1 Tax=Pseudomonas sp. NY15372 TaxID=3400356 RepID=UPI0018AAB674|nr:DUF1653 domain-containing protein [Pseudomonas monteilii]